MLEKASQSRPSGASSRPAAADVRRAATTGKRRFGQRGSKCPCLRDGSILPLTPPPYHGFRVASSKCPTCCCSACSAEPACADSVRQFPLGALFGHALTLAGLCGLDSSRCSSLDRGKSTRTGCLGTQAPVAVGEELPEPRRLPRWVYALSQHTALLCGELQELPLCLRRPRRKGRATRTEWSRLVRHHAARSPAPVSAHAARRKNVGRRRGVARAPRVPQRVRRVASPSAAGCWRPARRTSAADAGSRAGSEREQALLQVAP